MDHGISAEETLELMRKDTPAVNYLVGTPKGKLSLNPSFKFQEF